MARRRRKKKQQGMKGAAKSGRRLRISKVEPIVERNGHAPLIGIVFPRQEVDQLAQDPPDSHGNLYLDAAEQLGMTVFIFHPADVDLKKHMIRGWTRQKGQWLYCLCPWPDVFYERILENFGFKTLTVLDELYRTSIPINEPRALGKWECHRRLVQYPDVRPYLPDTVLYHHPLDLHDMLSKHTAVLTKPDYGGGGIGISKVWRMENGKYGWQDAITGNTLEGLTFIQVVAQVKANAKDSPFVVQEQLPLLRTGNRVSDIRLAMERDGHGIWQASISSLRLGKENLFITHGANGGELYPLAEGLGFYVDSPEQVDNLVKKVNAASMLLLQRIEESFGRLGEVALDLALDQDFKIWFLEANAKPGKFTTRDNKQAPPAHVRILEYGRYLWKMHHQNTRSPH